MKNYTEDSRIQGLVNITEADFCECFKKQCSKIKECSKNILNTNCIYEKPLVKVNYLEKKLENDFALHNATATEFLENICKHLTGESTPNLTISHCGISTGYDTPNQSSSLQLEIGRVAVSSKTRNGTLVTVTSNFDFSDGNTLQTAISSASSSTVFNLSSVIGLSIGDRLRITLDTGQEERKIQSISGNQITLATGLSKTPSLNNIAEQMISRLHLIANGTLTLNSGSAISLAPYIRTKSSTQSILITHTIRLK